MNNTAIKDVAIKYVGFKATKEELEQLEVIANTNYLKNNNISNIIRYCVAFTLANSKQV